MSTKTADEDFSVDDAAALRGMRMLGLAQSSFIVGAVLTSVLAGMIVITSVMAAAVGAAGTDGARSAVSGAHLLMGASLGGFAAAQCAHMALARRGRRAGWCTPAEEAIYQLPGALGHVAVAAVVLQLVVVAGGR